VISNAVLGAVAFGTWTLFLAVVLISYRGMMMLRGTAITEFPAGIKHGSDPYWRVNRAHANACENVGIAAAILLGTAFVGNESSAAHLLPCVIVGARMLQSTIHMTSGAMLAVYARFTMFFVQIGSLLWLAVEIFRIAAR